MGLFVLDIYLYNLGSMPKEAIADLCTLRIETSLQHNLPPGAITLLSAESRNGLQIRFDVSVLDYETKHEIDIGIRKVLRKHRIKFLFSNASNPKLNFYYGQKIMNSQF